MEGIIGCEESQTVTEAFILKGHNFFSNDLKEPSGQFPKKHIRADVKKAILSRKWDFIGLHPDCSKMTLSGNRHYAYGKAKHSERKEAVEWTIDLWELATSVCDRVYMENQMGAMNTDKRLPKPQIIQPYFFGDEFQKTTCLWLHGLPLLFHSKENTLFDECTHVGKGEMVQSKSGKIMPKWIACTPSTKSEENRTLRSKTFPGIAKAMADNGASLNPLP